ncbi:anti-sigma regulatory factor (Ser/Thr protein kinase) [Streptomyces sp. SAI-135]|uniref:sensor histidine kinase n=1 Tax=unclassified Streptomyces TaxID=2593676 RepID=UPI0024735F7C|nr:MULTISPECIES: sensor histidine kinase [unclassified Streptomyces]MDH6521445.1 anti-sigma regulatory factor (Ser/Thr protein kinase) [Streptomyces sp. SAI-090]MDH6614458.1 anti-sigma regulatory factor (Ser/Thr protein kinase) [Streptomyces sp. SAI-135]
MTLFFDSSTPPPAQAGYRHELYPYAGRDEFLQGTVGFIQEALDEGEAVVVAVPEHKASLLRSEVPEDGTVRYVDTSAVAHHPGRLIGAWQDWIKEQAAGGRPVRGIGESPWDEVRSQAQAEQLRYHEWLLNRAFADGPAWWLLCPYDTAGENTALEQLTRCHPRIRSGGHSTLSTDYDPKAPFAFGPLSHPCDPYEEFIYAGGDLPALREKISACAAQLGLGGSRLRELHLAATEIATNSIRHGGGQGTLRTWSEDHRLVCEFRDTGYITDPLAGRRRPTSTQVGGRGLWLAHQLCDLVEIRSTPDTGTTIRLHTELTG